MEILRAVFNSYMVNCYLLIDTNDQAILIDPAFADEQEWMVMKEKIVDKKLNLIRILITHSHADHIMGLAMVKRDFPEAEIMIHKDGLSLYSHVNDYSMFMGFKKQDYPLADAYLQDGQEIVFGDDSLSVFHTPGHAAGSVCFYSRQSKVIFTGDVLFRNSVGRTDLPGGSFEDLQKSIKTKLYTLPDDTTVLPGHGDESQIGFEKINNPFVKS